MPVRKTYKQEIRDFKFPNERLRIRRYDKVRYSVPRNQHSEYCSLDRGVPDKLVLRIEELGKESPPLFYRHDFEHQFQEKGLYHIYCPDNPGIRQQIIVEENQSNQSDYSIAELSDANEDNKVFFTQRQVKGDGQLICFKNLKGQNFAQISECLTKLKEGCPIQVIKTQYSQFFDYERIMGSFEQKRANDHSNSDSSNHRSLQQISDHSKCDSSFSELDNQPATPTTPQFCSIESSYELKKLSLMNPDLVFNILLKLKQKYQGKPFKCDSTDLASKSVEQLTLRVKEERADIDDQVYLPNRHSKDALDTAMKIMQSRFNWSSLN